jgi:hypothetical protein
MLQRKSPGRGTISDPRSHRPQGSLSARVCTYLVGERLASRGTRPTLLAFCVRDAQCRRQPVVHQVGRGQSPARATAQRSPFRGTRTSNIRPSRLGQTPAQGSAAPRSAELARGDRQRRRRHLGRGLRWVFSNSTSRPRATSQLIDMTPAPVSPTVRPAQLTQQGRCSQPQDRTLWHSWRTSL